MNLVEGGTRAVAAPDRPLLRLWHRPRAAHVGALAAVLLVLLPVVGWSASFSADEGAAIIQARSLARGDGWIVEHPLPTVDPEGLAYPLELSEWGERGVAPFGKHPLYALVLAGADRVGGILAMVLLSLVGTVAAAMVGAALARRLDPALERPALWVLGLGSPLLFDGYLVIAHTLGAALAGLAVLAAVVAVERQSRLAAAAVLPCVATAVLFRTEASLLAVGLAAAAATVVVLGRDRPRWPRWPGMAVAAAALVGAGGARLVERVWIGQIVGAPVEAPAASSPSGAGDGFLADRFQAFVVTWLRPAYEGSSPVVLLALVVMALAIVTAVLAGRRRPHDGETVRIRAAVAALAAVLALVLVPRNLVPGLLIAFPVGLAGATALRMDTLRPLAARLAFVTFAVFSAGVLATQYAIGGATEWGGRYFAIGLPVVVPVLLLGLRQVAIALDRATLVRAGASLAVCTVVLSTMSLVSLRATHRFTDGLMRSIDSVSQQASGEAEPPVLVTTSPLMPRLAWATFEDQRWLLSAPDRLADVIDRLGTAGVDRFTFVTRDFSRDRELLPPGLEVLGTTGREDGRGWQILVLATR